MAAERQRAEEDAPAHAAGGRQGIRLGQLLLAGVFLLGLWLPSLEMKLRLFPAAEIAEKRNLAEAPRFNPGDLRGFVHGWEEFYNDNFGLRDVLVRWDSRLHLKVLHASPVSKLIFGRDGWIFYNSEKVPDGVTIADHRGLAAYTPDQLRRIESNLTARGRWCAERGMRCLVVVVPNKETIYSDYLPAALRKVGPLTRLDQVLATVGPITGLELLDLRPALRQARAESAQPVYFRGGTHWNEYGAYYGYREIIRALSKFYPDLRPYELADFEIDAEPGSAKDHWLGMTEEISYRLTLRPSAARADSCRIPGKVAVIHDSFWDDLEPLVALHAPDLVAHRHDRGRDPSLDFLDRERPSLVVLEIAERYADAFWNR